MAPHVKHDDPPPRAKSCAICGKPPSHRAARSTCAECRDVPDAPAVEMRQALARLRDQGMRFPEAWAEALPHVLTRVPAEEREGWEAAFAWGVDVVWAAAYNRTGNVIRLALPDEDGSRPHPPRALDSGVELSSRAA